MKILFSNLAYATGIDGSLRHHASKAARHLFQTRAAQQSVLAQFTAILDQTDPDLCCLVEINQGSITSNHLNQIEVLQSDRYPTSDVSSKYGSGARANYSPFHRGKSNGFIAKSSQTFSKLYFRHGVKRLVYRIELKGGITLFFAHFSLRRKVRALQFHEMRHMAEAAPGDVIVFGDFNTFSGLGELSPLIQDNFLHLMNEPGVPTFRFHRWQHTLDLCLCSPNLASQFRLRVIDQVFSDHDALLLESL
jgi:endonuclease/exonuclease/phosphatase family metal-dependent hydrolase